MTHFLGMPINLPTQFGLVTPYVFQALVGVGFDFVLLPNDTIAGKFKWNYNNAFENILCKLLAKLFGPW